MDRSLPDGATDTRSAYRVEKCKRQGYVKELVQLPFGNTAAYANRQSSPIVKGSVLTTYVKE